MSCPIHTWESLSPSFSASFFRSGFEMYFCTWNLFSKPGCTDLLDQFRLHCIGIWEKRNNAIIYSTLFDYILKHKNLLDSDLFFESRKTQLVLTCPVVAFLLRTIFSLQMVRMAQHILCIYWIIVAINSVNGQNGVTHCASIKEFWQSEFYSQSWTVNFCAEQRNWISHSSFLSRPLHLISIFFDQMPVKMFSLFQSISTSLT